MEVTEFQLQIQACNLNFTSLGEGSQIEHLISVLCDMLLTRLMAFGQKKKGKISQIRSMMIFDICDKGLSKNFIFPCKRMLIRSLVTSTHYHKLQSGFCIACKTVLLKDQRREVKTFVELDDGDEHLIGWEGNNERETREGNVSVCMCCLHLVDHFISELMCLVLQQRPSLLLLSLLKVHSLILLIILNFM